MTENEIKLRLKNLAIRVAKLCLAMPYNIANKQYFGQIIRCSSSAGANYSAACRGKSTADWINKLKISEEELDEKMYFCELLAAINTTNKDELRAIYKEANELLSIIVASIKTFTRNLNNLKQKVNLDKTELLINKKT